jgi:ABC-type glycerol-3-phosphate transport system substrate-binding protein
MPGISRRRLLGALGAAPAALLTACAAGAGAPAAPAPPATAPAKLEYWIQADDAVVALWEKEAFPTFLQRWPGSTLVRIAGGNPFDRLLTLHAAGSAPDLFQGGDTWTYDVATQRLAVPLDARLTAWKDTPDFAPAALRSAHLDGKHWGLPWFITARTMYLRRRVLDEVGITRPVVTWEDWVEMARASTRVQDGRVVRQGFRSMSEGDAWWWFYWLLQTLQVPLYKDGKAAFGGGEAELVLAFGTDLDAAVAPPGAERLQLAGAEVGPEFVAGSVPHTWVHLGPLQQVQQSSPQDYETMVINAPPVPGNSKYRVPGNKSVKPYVFTDNALAFVSVQSKAPDHAWELLKLLVEPETFLEFNRLRGRLPPRQSLWTKGFMADKKVQEIATLYGKYSRARYRPAAFADVTAAINETVWAVVRDRKLSPRAGVEDLTARLNAIAQRSGYTGTTEA